MDVYERGKHATAHATRQPTVHPPSTHELLTSTHRFRQRSALGVARALARGGALSSADANASASHGAADADADADADATLSDDALRRRFGLQHGGNDSGVYGHKQLLSPLQARFATQARVCGKNRPDRTSESQCMELFADHAFSTGIKAG